MRPPRARRAATLACAATLAAAGCGDGAPRGARTRPPDAEFLVVTADSTYWVTSGAAGVRLRGSPLALTQYDGRFHEIYVTDDDHSYYDALFVGQRIYRRDLVSGDSAAVFDDPSVRRLAERYGARHPGAEPLTPDEPASDDPAEVATTEVVILDAHGPYLSFEHHADVDVDAEEEVHATRRGVIDLRTGREVGLAALLGEDGARRASAAGRAAFDAALDSVRASHDRRAPRAAAALANFAFDERSFSLTALGARPAVLFLVPGRGRLAEGLTLPLPAVAVREPAWWSAVRKTLPSRSDSLADVWQRGAYAVHAFYPAAGEAATLVLSDRANRRWAFGRLSSAALRLHWLDGGAIDSLARRGLARAFEESVFYSEEVRTVKRGKREEGRGTRNVKAPHSLRRLVSFPPAVRASRPLAPRS